MIAALLYLVGIAAAELITTSINIEGGIALYMGLLFIIILHSSAASRKPSHKLYLALALVPILRITSLSLPLSQFTQIYWYFFIAIPLLIAIFIAIKILNYQPSEVGLVSGNMPVHFLISLTGIGFGFVEYFILKPDSLITSLTLEETLLPAIIFLVTTGFVEELIFRGVIQRSSIEALGTWGWVYPALMYLILNIGYLSVIYWIIILIEGLFFGWIVKRTGSLLGVILSHGIINVLLYLVLPLTI